VPLEIVQNDITKMKVDAIVNAANSSLLGGGGVDGAIHRAAGPELLEECRTLNGCKTGQAKITKAYRLDAKYVIHTVGPVWRGGGKGERELLTGCYQNSLALAKEYGCETVAFPMISAGVYRYPRMQAMQVAIDTIGAFLETADMTVYLVVFDRESFRAGKALFSDVQAYIDDHYVNTFGDFGPLAMRPDASVVRSAKAAGDMCEGKNISEAGDVVEEDFEAPSAADGSLPEAIENLDESFSQAVLRIIDEKGITDVMCYKRANMDRKLFSEIRSDVHYKPGKRIAVALAIGLGLNLTETEALLKKAGFALSRSDEFDVIIEYFIINGIYDIHEINRTLFFFDQPLLGM